jgi:ferritin
MKLMDYQVTRGGRVVFQDIAKPAIMEWGSALQAVEATLQLEKTVRAFFFLKGLCHKIVKFIAAIMEWGSALQAVEATLELEKTVRAFFSQGTVS